jgi:hypothetical protein
LLIVGRAPDRSRRFVHRPIGRPYSVIVLVECLGAARIAHEMADASVTSEYGDQ